MNFPLRKTALALALSAASFAAAAQVVVNDAATKRNHIGRATDAEENFQLYSEKTLAADDHAFLLKVQDTVRAAAEEARFAQVVGMMREAAAVSLKISWFSSTSFRTSSR